MGRGDIWVAMEEDSVKHILSVLDIKKMIPIVLQLAFSLYIVVRYYISRLHF